MKKWIRNLSIVSRDTRSHFAVAIALVTVLPVLVTICVIRRGGFDAAEQLVIGGLVALLATLGYVMIMRVLHSIVRLRQCMEDIVAGELPEEVVLEKTTSDLEAIEHSVNMLVSRLKQRIEAAEREKDRVEKDLQQAEKLRSVGMMAATIAHEINTPTQFIMENVKFLSETFGEAFEMFGSSDQATAAMRKEIAEALADSQEGLSRIAGIVRAAGDFSRISSDDRTDVDINRVIRSAASISQLEWKYVADMDLDLDPGLPPVSCVWGDMNQVMLNLIVNAGHAVSEVTDGGKNGKGRITIRSRRDDDRVVITVSDTGPGISPDIAARIFEPFFTTKKAGGTGLGLSIAHSLVVKKHGGHLSCGTAAGGGAIFTVRLPCARTL